MLEKFSFHDDADLYHYTKTDSNDNLYPKVMSVNSSNYIFEWYVVILKSWKWLEIVSENARII